MIGQQRAIHRKRLGVFSDTKLSYLRSLQYEIVREWTLRGRVLDVGGGSKAKYRHLLSVDGTLESLNVSAAMRPTIVHDANLPFPIASATYDAVLSLNTLEHLREDKSALHEIIRILKPGGELHVLVPFLYRVHGSPSDFHRHTAFWWEAALAEGGIPAPCSRIEPMLWGRLTTMAHVLEGAVWPFLRRLPLVLDLILRPNAAGNAQFPLGYYIYGRKP